MGSGDDSNAAINFNQTETLVKPDIVYFSARPSKCLCNYGNRIGQLVFPDDVRKFNVTISIPVNYPLDFYYLMDLSGSMRNDLETIQELSSDISQCDIAGVYVLLCDCFS